MLKPKKILLLWLFLAMVGFFSCADVINTNKIDNFSVVSFQFLKGNYRINNSSGLPILEQGYEINECSVSDTLVLKCLVDLSRYYQRMSDLRIIIKTISYKTGDVKYVTLLQQGNIVYTTDFPTSTLMPYIGLLHVSDVGEKDDVLKVSLEGDILIVEIKDSYKKITKSINIIKKDLK